jgi:hypothetical protein
MGHPDYPLPIDCTMVRKVTDKISTGDDAKPVGKVTVPHSVIVRSPAGSVKGKFALVD